MVKFIHFRAKIKRSILNKYLKKFCTSAIALLYRADGARMDARKEDMQCAVSCLGTARVRVQGHLTRAPPRTHARLCSAAVLQAASGIGRHNSGYIRAMKDGGNCL